MSTITHRRIKLTVLSAIVFASLGSVIAPSLAAADPLPYGPDTCLQGFVWREANTNDHVCVTPEVRSRTASENYVAGALIDPKGGPYGPLTCKQGYVWREAFVGDTTCVFPQIRADAAADNAAAESRKEANVIHPAPPPIVPSDAVTMTLTKQGLRENVSFTNSADVAGKCTYVASPVNNFLLPTVNRTFTISANGSAQLTVPAPPIFTTYHAVMSCRGTYHGKDIEFGHDEQDVSG